MTVDEINEERKVLIKRILCRRNNKQLVSVFFSDSFYP